MPFVTGLALAIPATLAAQATDADYARHVERLKARLPAKTFTVVIEKPFVVIGDGPPREVERRASRTVRWAVRQLEAMYFERPPRHIIDVWLFAGDRSYRRWAKALFGDEPDTPYGYYSPSDRAMVMNISANALGLGNATADCDHHVPAIALARLLELPQPANLRIDFLGCLLPKAFEIGVDILIAPFQIQLVFMRCFHFLGAHTKGIFQLKNIRVLEFQGAMRPSF